MMPDSAGPKKFILGHVNRFRDTAVPGVPIDTITKSKSLIVTERDEWEHQSAPRSRNYRAGSLSSDSNHSTSADSSQSTSPCHCSSASSANACSCQNNNNNNKNKLSHKLKNFKSIKLGNMKKLGSIFNKKSKKSEYSYSSSDSNGVCSSPNGGLQSIAEPALTAPTSDGFQPDPVLMDAIRKEHTVNQSGGAIPKIRGSKSMQNLEHLTRESYLSLRDLTSSLKEKYNSRMELRRSQAKVDYDVFWDEDNEMDEEQIITKVFEMVGLS